MKQALLPWIVGRAKVSVYPRGGGTGYLVTQEMTLSTINDATVSIGFNQSENGIKSQIDNILYNDYLYN